MERQAKGIWVPIEIWENKNLTWNEKILFLEIDSFTSQDKDCFISNEYISQLLGITENSASRVLSSLISKGYVIKTSFDGRRRFVKTAFSYNKADYSQMNRQSVHECVGRVSECEYIPNTDNKTNTNINIDVVSFDKETALKKQSRFVKPTLEEVEAYIAEKGYCVNAQLFIDYYTSNGWKVGRNPMKDWKAAVRTWETKERKQYGQNRRFDTDTRTREERRAEFIQGIAAHLAAGNSGPVQDGRGDTLPF